MDTIRGRFACQTIWMICTLQNKNWNWYDKCKIKSRYRMHKITRMNRSMNMDFGIRNPLNSKAHLSNQHHWTEYTFQKINCFAVILAMAFGQIGKQKKNGWKITLRKNQHNNVKRLLFCPWNCQYIIYRACVGLHVRGRFSMSLAILEAQRESNQHMHQQQQKNNDNK